MHETTLCFCLTATAPQDVRQRVCANHLAHLANLFAGLRPGPFHPFTVLAPSLTFQLHLRIVTFCLVCQNNKLHEITTESPPEGHQWVVHIATLLSVLSLSECSLHNARHAEKVLEHCAAEHSHLLHSPSRPDPSPHHIIPLCASRRCHVRSFGPFTAGHRSATGHVLHSVSHACERC